MAKGDKRKNGEGNISWHEGNQSYMISLLPEGKDIKQRITRYAKDLGDAELVLADMRTKMKSGTLENTSKVLMKDFLSEWLNLVKRSLKPKTYDSYECTLRVHLIPKFGKIKLSKLTRSHINTAWDEMLDEGHSPTIVSHCHARLSTALNSAKRRGLITVNPMEFVTKPRVETPEINPLSEDQVQRVLDEVRKPRLLTWGKAASKDEKEDRPIYYYIIHAALSTGMRRNELLGLRWKNVDLGKGVINITHNIHVGKKGEVSYISPKTKAGRRSVTMSADMVDVMQENLEWQMDHLKITGETPVFVGPTGKVLIPSSVSHYFLKIARRLNLNSSFHDTRHTHATLLMAAGVHPKVVQERLGHSDIRTTLNIYSHVTMNLQEDAAACTALQFK